MRREKLLSKLLLIPIISAFWIILLIEAGCSKNNIQRESKISQEESQKIAEEFLRSSPTFKFDGIEDTLKLISTIVREKTYCWEFNYEFKCRQAGYGDRSGKMLAQVITFHRAMIVIQTGEVIHAMLDGRWDMLNQKIVKGG